MSQCFASSRVFPRVFPRAFVLSFVSLVAVTSALGCADDAAQKASDGGSADAATPDAAPTGAVCKRDADCDDGLYCSGEETCVSGHCQAGEPITCDDGVACTVDKCSESKRECGSAAADGDGDGHGDGDCKDASGKALGDDCDDGDPLSFPGNIETCDSGNRDDDCDPTTFGNKDSDDDGYFDAKCCNPESNEPGAKLACGNDCDDLKASVSPKSTEACDLYDNDCDGETDEGVTVKGYPDGDFDGHGKKGVKAVSKCAGSIGFATSANDCDDADPEVFEGQFEICDGKDNNCDGNKDEIKQDAPWFTDADADHFGDAASTPVYSCERIPGRVLSHNDCNDANAAVNHAAAELCDALDNDCSGARDFRLGINDFEDDDTDGVADADCTGGDDCDDTDPTTGDGKEEICDLHDNDCDDAIDEDTAQSVWYLDRDGDGWGTSEGTALARCVPIPGRTAQLGDCDDDVNSTHPGALERCNGVDDNCNHKQDEGAGFQCSTANAVSYCNQGTCAVLSCFPGYDDCNVNPDDGCECATPIVGNGDLCPTGTDAECDDGSYCNGKERCLAGECYDGTAIDCSAGETVLQGSFAISNSLDIQMLGGIETITGDLIISAPGLVNLTGLEALKTVGGDLLVQNNGSLKALVGSGLSNLIAVGGRILIEDNPQLKVIRLPSLVSALEIRIRNNDALATLDGFDSLVRVDGDIEIESNRVLKTFSAMQHLQSCGDLSFFDNEIVAVSLPALVEVRGSLSMSGASAYVDGLKTVSLPALTTVEGDLRIHYLSVIETISLPKLKAVNGHNFEIYYCIELTTLDLSSLTKFGSPPTGPYDYPYFEISGNPKLPDFDDVHAVDCPSQACSGYVYSNALVDNCAAKALLETFTNFSARSYGGNGTGAPDGGVAVCPDGSL